MILPLAELQGTLAWQASAAHHGTAPSSMSSLLSAAGHAHLQDPYPEECIGTAPVAGNPGCLQAGYRQATASAKTGTMPATPAQRCQPRRCPPGRQPPGRPALQGQPTGKLQQQVAAPLSKIHIRGHFVSRLSRRRNTHAPQTCRRGHMPGGKDPTLQ